MKTTDSICGSANITSTWPGGNPWGPAANPPAAHPVKRCLLCLRMWSEHVFASERIIVPFITCECSIHNFCLFHENWFKVRTVWWEVLDVRAGARDRNRERGQSCVADTENKKIEIMKNGKFPHLAQLWKIKYSQSVGWWTFSRKHGQQLKKRKLRRLEINK